MTQIGADGWETCVAGSATLALVQSQSKGDRLELLLRETGAGHE